MVDLTAQRFGLPPCLWIPIAAASEEAIEAHVGPILRRHGRSAGRANALLVETADYPPRKSHNVRLWSHADAAAFEARLYPRQQVWVHVDDSNYRAAFLALGGPAVPRLPRGEHQRGTPSGRGGNGEGVPALDAFAAGRDASALRRRAA